MDILHDKRDPKDIFPIIGGHRVQAGPTANQVHVVKIDPPTPVGTEPVLILTVTPTGDYSTYTLTVNADKVDPLFSEVDFKFRPGCFTVECKPEWTSGTKAASEPVIDYLAKDFDSFRHTMISAMMERVPDWETTSEADLDEVLLELFSAAADELSDYQDRVMNEAYFTTARKRVSLSRHARLMDYHIHQGNQASTWLALNLTDGDLDLGEGFTVWTGSSPANAAAVVFATKQPRHFDKLLNEINLYTWSDSVRVLKTGTTNADLKMPDKKSGERVRDLITQGKITHLLIQEQLNPATGIGAGRDPSKRQILQLIAVKKQAKVPPEPAPEVLQDSITQEWFLRVQWEEKDKLKSDYCFTIDCPTGKVTGVSIFCGNLVQVYQGLPRKVLFLEAGQQPSPSQEFYAYERSGDERSGIDRWGTICRLPDSDLLAYIDTTPRGEIPPKSTLKMNVEAPEGSQEWTEEANLIHSDTSEENGNRFVVETDELGRSIIRTGNGVNGRRLPSGAIVHCSYQIGQGTHGNIGSDQLTNFDGKQFPAILSCWNPFDVTNGRDPEPINEILRRVPEAYRSRQLRAVTLPDYGDRVKEIEGVSNSASRYTWTGSWRTVQLAIDPVGTTTLSEELASEGSQKLQAVKLIGEDFEIRPPSYVPLEIHVSLCIKPNYWPEDVKYVIEQEFSEGYTPDGRMGFFHPDLWTFGQKLRASQILGRLQPIEGVDHVLVVEMKRWNEVSTTTDEVISVGPNEVIQVRNDPDHMEKGFIDFSLKGGRQ